MMTPAKTNGDVSTTVAKTMSTALPTTMAVKTTNVSANNNGNGSSKNK